MSGDSVSRIFTRARLPDSAAGARIGVSELRQAWTEAQKPEGPETRKVHM